MKVFFPVLVLLTILRNIQSNKIISQEIFESVGTYDIFLRIGTAERYLQLELDMSIDFMWISIKSFKEEEIIRIAEKEYIGLSGKEIEAEKLLANITFENSTNISLTEFPFYFIESRAIRSFDSFPLGFSVHNKSFSIIDYLYQKKYIERLAFGLQYNNDTQSGAIHFGGIPDEAITPYQQRCKVIEGYSSWGCNLTQVIFDNKVFQNVNYSFFQSNQEFLYAPKEFMNYINSTVFTPYIKNETCYIASINEDIASFNCECESIKSFPSFHFIFGEIAFTLNSSQLFDFNTNECVFIVQLNEINNTEWIFGVKFLNNYISLYDYENKDITFYSKIPFIQPKELFSSRYSLLIKILSIILIVIMTPSLLMLIIHKFKIEDYKELM